MPSCNWMRKILPRIATRYMVGTLIIFLKNVYSDFLSVKGHRHMWSNKIRRVVRYIKYRKVLIESSFKNNV